MNAGLKSIARAWLPTTMRRWLRYWTQRRIFSGDFNSWSEARANARGYDDPVIIAKAIAAAHAVRDGRAAFERDTVLFTEPAAHKPLLTALHHVAARNDGNLHVVDFGGAFGSTWWQHRSWLSECASITWEVVEQPHFVTAGQREFTVGPLAFRAALDECDAEPASAVILLSSVLPYLEAPHALVMDIARRGYRHVLIDRTGFVSGRRDRLTLQRVPPSIYDASYPCWFFDRTTLLAPLAASYRIVAEWPSFDYADISAEFRGLLFERIKP